MKLICYRNRQPREFTARLQYIRQNGKLSGILLMTRNFDWSLWWGDSYCDMDYLHN